MSRRDQSRKSRHTHENAASRDEDTEITVQVLPSGEIVASNNEPIPKKKLKRVQQWVEKEELKKRRIQTLKQLEKLNDIGNDNDFRTLLSRSGDKGKKQSRREQLKREMRIMRMGMKENDIALPNFGLEGCSEESGSRGAGSGVTDELLGDALQGEGDGASGSPLDLKVEFGSAIRKSSEPSEPSKVVAGDSASHRITATQQRARSKTVCGFDVVDDPAYLRAKFLKSAGIQPHHFRPANYRTVTRPKGIQEAREKLPIMDKEQPIMDAINNHAITVVVGSTGSGKTTQVPQFLYEAAYPLLIGVTQPRRVAAVTMAQRVGYELNDRSLVGYQIRYRTAVSPLAKVKFMTDGILLRELANDFLLSNYSAILIDEAHERSVNTDLLIGLLSRVVRLRENHVSLPRLKVVIMSATLRVEDFTENARLFEKPPPVISVAGRQHSVTIHFSRRTPSRSEVVKAAFQRIVAIQNNKTQRVGSILVFLTGVKEIKSLLEMLERRFGNTANARAVVDTDTSDIPADIDGASHEVEGIEGDTNVLDEYEVEDLNEEEKETTVLPGTLEEETNDSVPDLKATSDERAPSRPSLHILPLFSLLPPNEQAKVFDAASLPENTRLVVLATNVAETSVTVPGVRYVIDCGLVKCRIFDTSGASAFQIHWTSKASADQRAGRAGRVAPGHCYRLFSSAVFERSFPEHSPPQILSTPIDALVLQMKSMNIEKTMNFPFPTPPRPEQLVVSETLLQHLGAVDQYGIVTELGKEMAELPVQPRYARMLVVAKRENLELLTFALDMVSILSIPDVLSRSASTVLKRFGKKSGSDAIGFLGILGAYNYFKSSEDRKRFCEEHEIRPQALHDANKLRLQLHRILEVNTPVACVPPSKELQTRLKQLLLSSFSDRVAVRNPLPARTLYTMTSEEAEVINLHAGSCVQLKPDSTVIYQDMEMSEMGQRWALKVVTEVDLRWAARHAPSALLRYGPPLDKPPPRYDSQLGTVGYYARVTLGPKALACGVGFVAYKGTNFEIQGWRLFAQSLLEGAVFPSLSKVTLNADPSMCTSKSSVRANSRQVREITATLARKGVMSKQALRGVWQEEDGMFLMEQVRLWVNPSDHDQLRLMWPPKD